MVRYYRTVDKRLLEEARAYTDSWICMIAPTEEEIELVAEENGVDVSDLKAALDDEERSRVENEDDYVMILVDIPTLEESEEKNWYVTIPMSIIVLPDRIITVCLRDNNVIKFFIDGRVKHFNTAWRPRFVLQLLYRNTSCFIQSLRLIDKESDKMEDMLDDGNMRNAELIELMGLEKSLVYFRTSLRSNEAVLERLSKSGRFLKHPADEELMEDVITENRQAIEMANIYYEVLDGMMSAFSSVTSNNLNQIMKILASVTIVLSVPTMVSSFYGMNLNLDSMPFSYDIHGFLIIIIFSVFLTIITILILKAKDML